MNYVVLFLVEEKKSPHSSNRISINKVTKIMNYIYVVLFLLKPIYP